MKETEGEEGGKTIIVASQLQRDSSDSTHAPKPSMEAGGHGEDNTHDLERHPQAQRFSLRTRADLIRHKLQGMEIHSEMLLLPSGEMQRQPAETSRLLAFTHGL